LAEYLDLADYLLIAEAVIGVPAETIAGWPGVGLADSLATAKPYRRRWRRPGDEVDATGRVMSQPRRA
jgi:hypothetical protein